MGFKRNYPVKILSNQINKLKYANSPEQRSREMKLSLSSPPMKCLSVLLLNHKDILGAPFRFFCGYPSLTLSGVDDGCSPRDTILCIFAR
jgi:hypothetical protein